MFFVICRESHRIDKTTGLQRRSQAGYSTLAPGQVFVGGGLYMPDSATKIRDAIAAHSQQWTRSISLPAFKKHCQLEGSRLARPPRGYDPAHPLIEDLKLKSFMAVANFSEKDACAPDFMDRFANTCEAAAQRDSI